MAAKLLYSATMSLDGYIAGPGGDMSWLAPHLGPNARAEALADETGALLVGHRTFGGDDPNRGTENEGAFGGTWHGPVVVLTHHAAGAAPVPDVTFVGDLATGVREARAAAGELPYVNVLGADVARQCLEAGLLDEVLVFVAPVLLGDGTRLLSRPGGVDAQLERCAVDGAPGAVGLHYRVLPQP